MKNQTVWLLFLLLLGSCQLWPGTTEAIPPLVLEAPPESAWQSLTAVSNATAPVRDMRQLAARFQGIDAPLTRSDPVADQVGDVVLFWVKELAESENGQTAAELVYQSADLNMWVETSARFDQAALQAAARQIENHILPTNRAFFGTEWQPGVDGDNRINILHVAELGGVGIAYFWSGDEYVTAVNPYSNQREMLTVSLAAVKIGSDDYYRTIAHELQHLIQWQTDPNEASWLNEGLGELAAYINGYQTGREAGYGAQTDIQLTNLSQSPAVIGAHYSASALFTVYFRDRFGEGATQALVQQPANGRFGFDAVLQAIGAGMSFDDLFADWLVANYLSGAEREQGAYRYDSLKMPALNPPAIRRFPADGMATVNQYGADYLQLESNSPLTVIFTGTQQVPYVATTPHSGDYVWATTPADQSHMRLTAEFDLTDLDTATLTFWSWYDIESGWDYAYVALSVDNGRSWQLLTTEATTTDNPEGNSFGPGLTGISGGGDDPVWIQQTADLSPFAGQPVLLSFEYITDDAVHEAGWLLDDIAIPELGYEDGAEQGDERWQAAGFVRTGVILPQQFRVQAILLGEDAVEIHQLELDSSQQGKWTLPLSDQMDEAILIIAGMTPVTQQPAVYAYHIQD